ncbi:hypothetical protein MIS45_03570 [Wielerella bovis]|uniref:hypothetical protein n=1 Tax=Wielerella bovis TaxID=2917790 RepID=UPI002019B1AE|nr:hypothetical protein [Wielerella bovis]ULJ69925.1 hypothetical protein MIS45_03570 [Wielerella bovis]
MIDRQPENENLVLEKMILWLFAWATSCLCYACLYQFASRIVGVTAQFTVKPSFTQQTVTLIIRKAVGVAVFVDEFV